MLVPDLVSLLAAYPSVGRPTALHPLGGAGGFSGAQFWRVETAHGLFCLRRWPTEYPQASDLDFIHSVLRHAASRGFLLAAVPLETSCGETYLTRSGHLWEVAPWMPGKADFADEPTATRLAAAMECVARFHRAAEEFSWTRPDRHRPACPSAAPSPGIGKRVTLLREWIADRARQLDDVIARGVSWPEMRDRAQRLLRLFPKLAPSIAENLAHFNTSSVSLQPCIRDVWHDHLLFQEDKVTGLIDFGSMGVDNVSCDVARLLGSLAGRSPDFWRIGLQAYTSVRDLSDVERGLVQAFDRSGVLLGALNWAAWTLLDGRVFDEPQAVFQRMDALMERLEAEPPLARSQGKLLL